MFDLKLPDFEMIVWIKNNDFGKKLEKEILLITKGFEVYDHSETKDNIVYHWIVPSWLETLVVGGKLKEFTDNPNLIFLKLKANYDQNIQDVTLKDIREYNKL